MDRGVVQCLAFYPAIQVAPFTLCCTERSAQRFQMTKTRQKLNLKIREIDGSFLCLQQFDKFWIWSARNKRKRKLFEYKETCMKKFVKLLQVNLFLADFSSLKGAQTGRYSGAFVWTLNLFFSYRGCPNCSCHCPRPGCPCSHKPELSLLLRAAKLPPSISQNI